MTLRPFNGNAYDHCDKPCKNALIALMESRGYALVGSADIENYKKYDLMFTHKTKGTTISFENEMRENYDDIKCKYSSIHIPERKRNSQSTYYVIWNYAMDEFALIKTSVIKNISDYKTVEIHCKARNGNPAYTEYFIDVPKEYVNFYYKAPNNKWKALR